MGPMLTTLFTHPEKGFLHGEFYWNFTGPVTIQYWRSFEDLNYFVKRFPLLFFRPRMIKLSIQAASGSGGG